MSTVGSSMMYPGDDQKRCLVLNPQGFTLMEVMIALVLASLVLLSLTAGSGFVIREWSREKNTLDDSLDTALVFLRLERALAGAFPHVYLEKKNKPEKKIFFAGKEESLAWVSTVAPGGIQGLAGWSIVQEDTNVSIFLVPAMADNPADRLSHSEPVVVLPGYSLSLQYLEEKKTKAGQKPERKWLSTWSAEKQNSLPVAVLLHLEKNEDQRGDIRLLVPIRANEHRTIKPKKNESSGFSTDFQAPATTSNDSDAAFSARHSCQANAKCQDYKKVAAL